MQNRFGLKDFVLLIMLILVGVSVWIGAWQEDRRFERVQGLGDQLGRLEQQMAMLNQRLEEGIIAQPAAGHSSGATRDDSWARSGYDIRWAEPFRWASDPRGEENFATGGTYTELFEAQPPTITPYLYTDVYGRRVVDQVVDMLGRYHPETLEWQGVLAEAWQLDPGGMWMRIKMRENARFSDGEPVTADDVKFSYEFFMNPEVNSPRWRASYNVVEDVEVLDTHVVEFRFEEPNFLNKERALTMYIIPEHFYEQFTSSEINQSTGLLMGSGPFRLRNLDPDSQWRPGRDDVVLVRNEQYWGPRSPLEQLRYRAITDRLALLTEYNNRQADAMRPTDRQFVRHRDREDWLETNRAKQWFNVRSGYTFIAWNGGKRDGELTFFHDPRVRRAMTHLIDRQYVIDHISEGIGEIATGPFNPRTDQANPNIEPLEYNMDKARELLAEAGWKPDERGVLRNERGDRFTFEYTFSRGTDASRQMAEYLRDQCARVGIRCELNPVDWSIFSDIYQNRDFDAITMGWSPGTPEADPYSLWHSDNIRGRGDNFAQWHNERADELIEAGRQSMDPDFRREKWHELHQIIHEEQPYTFMRVAPWLRFFNRRLENVHPYMMGIEPREFYIPLEHQAAPM